MRFGLRVRAGLISGNITIGEHKVDVQTFFAPYFIHNKDIFTSNFIAWAGARIPYRKKSYFVISQKTKESKKFPKTSTCSSGTIAQIKIIIVIMRFSLVFLQKTAKTLNLF